MSKIDKIKSEVRKIRQENNSKSRIQVTLTEYEFRVQRHNLTFRTYDGFLAWLDDYTYGGSTSFSKYAVSYSSGAVQVELHQ